jgi:hypothetical protein
VDMFDVARSCVRRWYVFLPLVLIVGWFSYSTYSQVKPVYYSYAVIGVAPPSVRVDDVGPGIPLPRNGLLDIGGATLIANMASVALHDPAVVDRVVAAGGQADYVAKMFPVTGNMPQLPIIMIEETNQNPAAVTTTLEAVTAQAGVTLRTLQQNAKVPEDQMVQPLIVTPPAAPSVGMPSRTKTTVAIFGAGVALSVVVTVLVDVLLTRRKAHVLKRRAASSEPIAEGPAALPEQNGVEPSIATTAGVTEGVAGTK